jgi:site-specific DNA-methyltransferase (adenine-specific)
VTPYYADDLVTLYHGDAAEVLAQTGPYVGAIVTDPPYNVGLRYDVHDDRMEGAAYLDWLAVRFRVAAEVTVGPLVWFWQGSRLANGDVQAVLPSGYVVHHVAAWFKREFAGDLWKGGHPAYSWEPIVWARDNRLPASYFGPKGGHEGRDGLIGNSSRHDGVRWHPCPKPLSVVSTIVSWVAGPAGVVVDPFAGSGTTLLAAKRAGRRAVGVEISEAYCERIAERCSQEVLGLSA